MGSANNDISAANWNDPAVFKQFNTVRLAFVKLVDDYHRDVMSSGFLSDNFKNAVTTAAENMSPNKMKMLKICANPKALGLWDFTGAEDGSPEKVASFLSNSFSDSCGHLLMFSSFRIRTNEDVIFNLKRIMGLSVGINNVAKNYEVILADDLEGLPKLKRFLKSLKEAAKEADKASKQIGSILGIEPMDLKAMKDKEVDEMLNKTTSIAYIKPIRASKWRAEPA